MLQTNLLNHLWQSTLFAAIAGLLTLALRNNRAPVRYWLWFAASLKFLIPFSVLVTVGSQFELRKAPAAPLLPVYAAPLTVAIKDVSRPFVPSAPVPADRTPFLLGLWVCGASVVLIAWTRQWLRVRSALRSASPLDLNLPIRAMSSPARLEPGVFGVFRPTLLVPEGITDRLSPDQWQAILAHELCHVRRRDNLTAAIHMAVEAIFWFHPLVWWIGRRLVDERERACDEAVLLTSADPESYAEGILNVCKLYLGSPLPCVSGVTGSNLKDRIRAIMTQRVAADLVFAKKLALAVAAIAALAFPVAIGVLHAPPMLAQSPPPPPATIQPASAVRPTAPRIVAQAQNPQPPAPKPEQPAPVESRRLPELFDRQLGGAQVDLGTYIIGANDILNVELFGHPDYSRLYPVRQDGILALPHFGDVKAEGLTPLQFKKVLTEIFAIEMRDPEVTLTVWDVRSKKYTVAGGVLHPGSYPLSKATTVWEGLRVALRFLDDFSKQNDILILRGSEIFHFNLETYLSGRDLDQNIPLQNGDTIVVK
jgi:beta-lactamase regulating signal transducer with metallopeptidase domain/protein involved in polysaccharide export with SLBB domain